MNEIIKSLKARDVADYFIWKSQKSGKIITNKKLQKLLYYSQAWSVTLGKNALFPEKIEAWVHGPVVREVYFNFKSYSSSPITEVVDESKIKKIPSDIQKFLNNVWDVYGKFDSNYLEMLTHSEEPWLRAREGMANDEISENEISISSMREYYSGKLKNAKI